MCDKSTRVWCCRIGLVFTVLGVLCTMMFQIWSYYFQLVKQMDDMTLETPQLHSIIHICDAVNFTYNAECVQDTSVWRCEWPETTGAGIYIQKNGVADIEQGSSYLTVASVRGCVELLLWSLPW